MAVVPSELCPLPALRMLPTLPSLPTLFLSPAAGAGSSGQNPSGPHPQLAGQSQTLRCPASPYPLPERDIPGLSGLRPTRGSWP